MKTFFVIVVIVVIAVGAYGLSVSKKSSMVNEDAMVNKEAVMKNEDKMMKAENTQMKVGSYEPYLQEKLSMATTGKVVLFFRASWCPTCKALDADINSNLKNIPENVTILDVDYDNSTDLKKKYGVTYQHTLVEVGADGSMIKKWAGSPTLAALVKEIK